MPVGPFNRASEWMFPASDSGLSSYLWQQQGAVVLMLQERGHGRSRLCVCVWFVLCCVVLAAGTGPWWNVKLFFFFFSSRASIRRTPSYDITPAATGRVVM